ncbi:MAG: hypothetical protein H7326_03370 [Bdellovibrionaceae bacterium]|nr:hypothetical protein [Pseudobdellovibrionaceae bacterium]
MKSWSLIPIVLILSATSFATTSMVASKVPKTTALLSQQQFSSLTYTEQLTYIKKVREIFVEMSESNPALAAEFAKRSGLFAAVMDAAVPAAIAQDVAKPAVSKYQSWKPANDNEAGAKKFLDDAATYIHEVSKSETKDLSASQKEALLNNFEGASKMIRMSMASKMFGDFNQETQNLLQAEIDRLAALQDENLKSLKTALPKNKKVTQKAQYWTQTKNDFKTSAVVPIGESDLRRFNGEPFTPVATSKETVKPASGTKVTVDEGEPAKDKKPAPEKPEKKASPDGASGAYRCMYAGFVIKGEDCIAPKEIPWALTGLPKPFACEGDSVMCNPLVFGVQVTCKWTKAMNPDLFGKTCMADSKPYCVRKQSQATKECNRISASSDKFALESAVFLNSRNENSQNIAEFNQNFEDLCDRENIDYTHAKSKAGTLTDVRETCKKARGRFEEVKKRYGIEKDYDDAKKDEFYKKTYKTRGHK